MDEEQRNERRYQDYLGYIAYALAETDDWLNKARGFLVMLGHDPDELERGDVWDDEERVALPEHPENNDSSSAAEMDQSTSHSNAELLFIRRMKGLAGFEDRDFRTMAQYITPEIDAKTFVDGLPAYISFTREYPYEMPRHVAVPDPTKRMIRRELVPHDENDQPDWAFILARTGAAFVGELLDVATRRKPNVYYWGDVDGRRWHWWWSPGMLGDRPVDHEYLEESARDDDYPW